ncbi:MAG TPA: ABC transporter substrate-binding protein [Candidatus Paceibacterota bacterium]|nr:ABC transporter substrate-binding protein [Candidatus Paceibacterota bacterium]
MTEQFQKEFRLKRGAHILQYISKFSATEKAIFGALVIIAGISALALATKASSLFMTEVPAVGGELREGEIGLPRTINPILAVSDVDRDIGTLIYSGLTKYEKGAFLPDLARSWTISPDGLTYDFILKDGLVFQDGVSLTADDVAFTVQKIQDAALKSPRQGDWANVTVQVVSPSEIQFTLKQPYSGFLANTTLGIIPKHIWGSVSDDQFIFSQYNIQPIGSGPYKIGTIDRDSGGIPTSYHLTSWKGYYGARPFIQTISFYFFSREDKSLSALTEGTIDSLPSVDPTIAKKLATNTGEQYRIMQAALPRIFGVFFNQNQSAVLADPVVRKALTLATDRKQIIDEVLSGYGTPAYGPIPDRLLNDLHLNISSDQDSITSTLTDAQALLEKNGWKKNDQGIYEKKSSKAKTASTLLSFDIYTANTPDLVATARLLKAQWSLLGAQVDVQIFEPSDLYQNVIRTRKYDALLFGEQIGKDRDLYAFWHSSQRNAPGLNVALYANSKVDTVLTDIRATASTTVMMNDYSKLDQLIRADLPALFLYSPDFIYAVPKTLQGVRLDSITVPGDHWNSVTDWYIETEKVWNIFK